MNWLLYEHDNGRYAVAPSAEAATFANGAPAWHRVGPVAVPAARLLSREELYAIVNREPSYIGALEAVQREALRVNGLALADGVPPTEGGK